MNAYSSRNDDFDDLDWEDELPFIVPSFEKAEYKKPDNRKLRIRRQIEDIQERRTQKKRVRLAMNDWGDLAY